MKSQQKFFYFSLGNYQWRAKGNGVADSAHYQSL
jgi:hypothetical protein